MRTFTLEVNGAIRQVQATREGSRFVIVLDGSRHVLDAAEIEPGRWSLLFDAERHSHEVLVRHGRGGGSTVIVDGATVPARMVDPRRGRRGVDASAAADGPVRVTAPMPGKIVRVLVAPGDTVEARQPLVVVEAMKMENELRAARGGTVRDLQACPGASVEAGTLLMTIG